MKQSDRWQLTTISYGFTLLLLWLINWLGLFKSFNVGVQMTLTGLFNRPGNEAWEVQQYIVYSVVFVVVVFPGVCFRFFKLHEAVFYTLLLYILLILSLPVGAFYGWGVLPLADVCIAAISGCSLAIILTLIFSAHEQQLLRSAFSRYVSPEILSDLLRDPESLALSGREQLVTVMFLDIRGFTSFTEQHDPELVVKRLNELLGYVATIVIKHKGTVDKYMGDAVMALWGAPVKDQKQTTHALLAAVEICRTISTKSQFRVGIGMHHGKAIVGNVGSMSRLDFTAIGDTVNTASRLQTASKELGSEVVISESVYLRAKAEHAQIDAVPLGKTLLRGKQTAIATYGLRSVR